MTLGLPEVVRQSWSLSDRGVFPCVSDIQIVCYAIGQNLCISSEYLVVLCIT